MMKKKIVLLLTSVAFAAVMNVTAFAGWQQNGAGWWYSTNTDNSAWHSNGWQWIDGNGDGISECYYFDQNGYMLADTLTPDGYSVDANGAWTIDGMVQTQNTVQTTVQSSTDQLIGTWTLDDIKIANDARPSTLMYPDKFTSIVNHPNKDLDRAVSYGRAARNIIITKKDDGLYYARYFADGLEWQLDEFSDGILCNISDSSASYYYLYNGQLVATSTNSYSAVNDNDLSGAYYMNCYRK